MDFVDTKLFVEEVVTTTPDAGHNFGRPDTTFGLTSQVFATEEASDADVSSGPWWLEGREALTELRIEYDAGSRSLWQWMAPQHRPSFTEGLLKDMAFVHQAVERAFGTELSTVRWTGAEQERPNGADLRYLVLGSDIPGIFNLGGNLALFQQLIKQRDRDSLRRYARVCARGQFRRADHFGGRQMCSIALVQGDALGGGFEAALAHDVIIAERSAKFGLPEVLFNMFPGMGAYTFLARRLDAARAERLILSGKVYSAEELYDIGLVDRVVDDGAGVDAVYGFIAQSDRQWRTRNAVSRMRDVVCPLSLDELIRIADVWVETAMSLSPADLRRMQHLAKAQDRRYQGQQGGPAKTNGAARANVLQAAVA